MKPEITWKEEFVKKWQARYEVHPSELREMAEDFESLLSSSQALARRSAIEEAMRVVEKAKKGIDYDNNPISNFGHILTNLILEALQEKLDTKGV